MDEALFTAPVLCTRLAHRFDDLASVAQGVLKRKAARNAQQLRKVAQLTMAGYMTTDDALIWADAAAGQLTSDRGQFDRKVRK